MSGMWHTPEDLNKMFRGLVIAKVVAREPQDFKLVFTDGSAIVFFVETNGTLGYADLPNENYPDDAERST